MREAGALLVNTLHDRRRRAARAAAAAGARRRGRAEPIWPDAAEGVHATACRRCATAATRRRRCARPPRPSSTRYWTRPRAATGQRPTTRAALDDRHGVREVDRRADVVRDDRDAIADRARRRPAARSTTPCSSLRRTTSQSSWPQTAAEGRGRIGDEHPVGGEHLRAGVDDDPVGRRAGDDGRDRERGEVGGPARALRDLAAVVEDVRAGPHLGHAGAADREAERAGRADRHDRRRDAAAADLLGRLDRRAAGLAASSAPARRRRAPACRRGPRA